MSCVSMVIHPYKPVSTALTGRRSVGSAKPRDNHMSSYPTPLKHRMVASAVKLVFGSSLAQCFPVFPSVRVSAQRPLSPQHATGPSLSSEVFSIRVLYRTISFFVYRSFCWGGCAALYPALGILLVALSKRMCRCWEDVPDFCSY